jgi:uncharacterized protein (DUF1810 family)
MQKPDPFHLQRFTEAQAGVWEQAREELRAGQKRSHWMWFIFPQIQGLGSSPMAVRYAIGSRGEARAYLEHPVLGERLRELSKIVANLDGRSIEQIFGYPDDLKFHSSMTLFAQAAEGEPVFAQALAKYFRGELDRATLEQLA